MTASITDLADELLLDIARRLINGDKISFQLTCWTLTVPGALALYSDPEFTHTSGFKGADYIMTHSNTLNCVRSLAFDALCFGHIERMAELVANVPTLLSLGSEKPKKHDYFDETTFNALLEGFAPEDAPDTGASACRLLQYRPRPHSVFKEKGMEEIQHLELYFYTPLLGHSQLILMFSWNSNEMLI